MNSDEPRVFSRFTIGIIINVSDPNFTDRVHRKIERIAQRNNAHIWTYLCRSGKEVKKAAEFLTASRHVHIVFTTPINPELSLSFKHKDGHRRKYSFPKSHPHCPNIPDHRPEGHVPREEMGLWVTTTSGVLIPKHHTELRITPADEQAVTEFRKLFAPPAPAIQYIRHAATKFGNMIPQKV